MQLHKSAEKYISLCFEFLQRWGGQVSVFLNVNTFIMCYMVYNVPERSGNMDSVMSLLCVVLAKVDWRRSFWDRTRFTVVAVGKKNRRVEYSTDYEI